jgi:hypothetical protein
MTAKALSQGTTCLAKPPLLEESNARLLQDGGLFDAVMGDGPWRVPIRVGEDPVGDGGGAQRHADRILGEITAIEAPVDEAALNDRDFGAV